MEQKELEAQIEILTARIDAQDKRLSEQDQTIDLLTAKVVAATLVNGFTKPDKTSMLEAWMRMHSGVFDAPRGVNKVWDSKVDINSHIEVRGFRPELLIMDDVTA